MKWRNLSWILLLTFTLLIKNCYCRGVLTIWLLNYRNIKGRTYDGSCCDAAPLGSSTCPDQCDYVMRCIVTGLGRANDHVFLFHRPIKYDSNDISFEDESSQMTQLTVLFDEWPAAGNVKMDVFFYDYDDDDHTTVLVDWFETPLRRTVDKGEKQLETVKGSRQLDKTILEFRWSVHCFGANDCLKPPPEWHKWPWQPEERTAVLLESSSVRTFDSTKHLSKANSYDKSTTTWNPNNKPSTVKVFNKQNSQEWEETKEHDWAGNSVWFNKSPFLPFHPFQRDRVAGETESDEALLDAQEHARIIDAEEREDLPAVKSNILDKNPSPSVKEKKDHRKHRRKKKKKKIIQETSDKKTQIISNSIYPNPYLTDKGIENTKNHLNQDSNAIENKLDKGAQAMVPNVQVKSNRSTQRKMKNEISHKPYHGLHSENLSQSAARDKSERIEKFIQITEIKSGAVQTVRNPYLQEPYRTINDYRRGKIRGFDRKTKILSSSRPTFHTPSNTKKLSSVSSTNSPKSILLQENVKVVQNDSNSKVPKIKQTLVGDSIQKPNKVLQSKAKSANNISTQNAETQPAVSASDINSLSQRPPLQERTGVTVKIQNDKRLDQHEIITKTDLKLDTKPSSDIISPSQLPPLQERTTVTVKEQNDKKLDKHKIITKTDLKLDTKPSSSNTRIPPDLRKGTTDISRSKTTSEIDIAKITGTSSRNKMVSSGTSKQTPNKPKRVTRPPPPTRKWDYNYDWKKHYKDYVMPRKRLPNVKSHAVVWTDAPPGLKKPNRRQRIGIAQTGAKRYPTKILNQLKEERKQHPSHYGYYRQKHNEFITEHNKKVKEQKKKKKLMELEKNSKGKSDSKLKLENPNSATHVSKTKVHSTYKKKHARTKTTTYGDQESVKENKNKKISRDQEGVADLTTSTPIPDIKYDYKHSDTPTKEISRKSTDKVGKQVESKSPYQRPTVDRNMAVEETGDIDSTRSDKIDPQINKGGLIKSESPLNPVIKPSQIYDRRVVVDPVTPRLNVPVNPAVLSRQTRLPYRANLIQGQGFTGWSDDFSTAIPPVNPSAIAPSNGKSSGPKSPVYLRDGIGSLKPTDLRPHLASKDRVVYNHMLKSSSTAYSSGQPDLANQNQDWSQLGISTKRMLKLDHSRSTPAINSGIKENVEPNNNDQTSVSGAVVRFDNQKSERDPPPFSNTNDQTSVSGEVAQLDNQKSERSPPPFPNTNDQTSVSWAVAKLDNQMAEKSPPPFPNTKGTGAYSKNGVSILNKNSSVILSREQIKPRIAVSEIQNVNKSPFSPKPPTLLKNKPANKHGDGYQSAFASTTDRDLNELNWYTDKKDEKHSRQMVSRQDHLNVAKTINPMQSGHIKSSIIPRIETDSVTALVNKSNLLRNDEADTNSPRNPKIISQGISTTSSSLNEDLYQPKINDILESLTPGKKSPFKPKGRRPKGRGNRRKNRKQQRVHENLTKAKHVSTPGRVTLKTDSWKLTMFPSKFSSRQSVRYTSNDMTTQPFLSPVPTPTIPRDMHQHVMNLPTPPREDLTSTGGPQIPGIISSGEEITGSDKFTLNLPEVAVLTPVFSNRKTTTAVYRFKTKPPEQKTTKSNLAIFDSTTSNIGKDFKSLRTKGFSTSDPVQAISPPTNPRRFTPNDVWKSFKILNDLMDKASKVNIGNKNTGQARDASIFKKSRKNPIQKLSPFNKYKPSTHKTVQHETTTPGTVRHSPKSIFTKQSLDKNNHFVIQNNGSKLDQPAKPFQDNDDTTSKINTRLNNLSQIYVTPQPAGTFSIPSSQAPVIFFPTQNGKTVSTEGHMNIFEFLPNAIKNVYFGRSYSSANKSSATTDKSVSTPRLKVTASNEVTKKLRSPYIKVDDTGLNKTTPSRNQFILPVNNHHKAQLYPQANPGSLENQLTYDKTSNGETLNFNYHESEKNKSVENVLFQEKNASVARTTPQLKPDRGQPTDTVVRPTIGTKRSFKHQPETDLKGKTQHEGIFDGTTHRIPIVTSNKWWQHRISTKKNTQDPLSVGTWHNNKDTASSNHRQYTSRDDDKRIKPNYISPATESAASDVFHKSLRSTTTPLTVSTNPRGYKTLDDTKHKSNFQPSPTRLSSMGVRVNTESAASDVFHKSLRSTTIPLTVSTNPKGFKTSDDTKHKSNFQPFPTRLSSMGVRVNTGTPSPTKFNRPSSSHASTTTSKSQSSSRKTATKRVRFHDFKTIHGNAAKTTNVNEMQTSNNAINEQRTTFRQLDLKAGVTTGKRGIHTTKTNFGYTLHSSTTNGNRRNTDQTRTGGTSKANVLNTTTKQIIHSQNTDGGTNNKAEVTLSSLTTNSTPINKISTTTTKGGLTVNPKSFNPTPKTKNETTKLNITSDIFKWIYDLSKSFPKRLNHEPGTGQKNHTDSSINLLTSSKNITTTVRGPSASSIKPPSTYISISPSGLSPKGETKRTEKSTVSGIYNATNGKARTEMVSLDTLGSSLKPTTSTEQSHAPTKSTTSQDNLGLFFGWSLPKEASPSTTTKNQSKGTSGTSSHTPEIKSTTKASRAVTTTKQNATSQPTLSTTAKTQPSTTLQPKKQNTTKTTKQSTNPTTAESTTVTTPKKILLTLPPWLKLPDPNKPKTTTQKPKTTQKPTTTSTTTTTTTRKITKKVNKKTTKKSKKKVTKKTSKKTTAGTTTLKTTTTDLPNTTNRKPAAPKRPVNITINNDPGANNGPRIIVPNGGLYIPQPRDFNSSDGFLDFGLPGSSEARNLRLQVRKMNLKTVFSRYWPAILGLTVGTVFLVAAVLTSVACRQQRLYIRRSGWTDMPHHVSEPPDTSEYSSAASLVSDATRSSISFP